MSYYPDEYGNDLRTYHAALEAVDARKEAEAETRAEAEEDARTRTVSVKPVGGEL